jgi:hypothetical protein
MRKAVSKVANRRENYQITLYRVVLLALMVTISTFKESRIGKASPFSLISPRSPSDGRIGESRQWIRIVRLDSNDHSLVQQHLDPNYKSYRNRHAERVGLPVISVNSRHFASICNYIGRSRNLGTVLAPNITDNTWIPSYPFHFISILPSEEFNLSVIYN